MIAIQTDDVDICALIASAKKQGTGAVVVFDGVVRDDDITEMELEAYEDVAMQELEKIAKAYEDVAMQELEKIAKDATKQFQLLHVDIIHRIGRFSVGDNILIIVVSARHRPEAYAGSRYIIEEIKKSVPIWKKELTKEGGRWVSGEHGHGKPKTV
jgi:molybdopterin synthase catalytic subunit